MSTLEHRLRAEVNVSVDGHQEMAGFEVSINGRFWVSTEEFIGTFSTFSWVAPTFEFWDGFTFGIRTTPRIEPDPPGVPEPASLALFSVGAAGLALARRRRHARRR